MASALDSGASGIPTPADVCEQACPDERLRLAGEGLGTMDASLRIGSWAGSDRPPRGPMYIHLHPNTHRPGPDGLRPDVPETRPHVPDIHPHVPGTLPDADGRSKRIFALRTTGTGVCPTAGDVRPRQSRVQTGGAVFTPGPAVYSQDADGLHPRPENLSGASGRNPSASSRNLSASSRRPSGPGALPSDRLGGAGQHAHERVVFRPRPPTSHERLPVAGTRKDQAAAATSSTMGRRVDSDAADGRGVASLYQRVQRCDR